MSQSMTQEPASIHFIIAYKLKPPKPALLFSFDSSLVAVRVRCCHSVKCQLSNVIETLPDVLNSYKL